MTWAWIVFFHRICHVLSHNLQAAASSTECKPELMRCPKSMFALCFGLSEVWNQKRVLIICHWINCGHVAVQLDRATRIIRSTSTCFLTVFVSQDHSVPQAGGILQSSPIFSSINTLVEGKELTEFSLNHSEPSFTLSRIFLGICINL